MRMWFRLAMCAALLGLAALPSPVVAQQKTVKACQDEWRANKADNQAKELRKKRMSPNAALEALMRGPHQHLLQRRHLLLLRLLPRRRRP
jgi:hypothetical protein